MIEAMGQGRDQTGPEGGETSADPVFSASFDDSHAASEPEELVEPSRALALADFTPPVLGASERLLRLAYRLGVPASTLAAPFRKPAKTRLLATVLNPLPGQKMAGTAIRAGHFLVYG
ncbi:MAG: hypothetical protein ACKOW1_07060, partial [Novosphingobium sp.]